MTSKRAALFLLLNVVLFAATTACTGNSGSGGNGGGSGGSGGGGGSGGSGGGGGGSGNNPPSSGSNGRCPVNALKLGVCANVLNGLVNVTIGNPPRVPCCPLLQGLVDLEAAICLCTAIRGNILGINLNLPIALSLVLNYCGLNTPRGFQCP